MVIRFEKRGRNGVLPLFDRLSAGARPLPSRRLTEREVEHRQQMLAHLQSLATGHTGAKTSETPEHV